MDNDRQEPRFRRNALVCAQIVGARRLPLKIVDPHAPTNGRAQLYRVASAVAHQSKLHQPTFKLKIDTNDHPFVGAMLEVVDVAAWGRDFAAPQVMLATVGVRNVIPHRQRPSVLVLRRSRPSLLDQSCICAA